MNDRFDPAGTAANIIKAVNEQSTSRAQIGDEDYAPLVFAETHPQQSIPTVNSPEFVETVHSVFDELADSPPNTRTSPRRPKPTAKILDSVADDLPTSKPKSGKGRAKAKLLNPEPARINEDGKILFFLLHS